VSIRAIVVGAAYITVLRTGARAGVMPLVAAGALDRFRLRFNFVGLYYCA